MIHSANALAAGISSRGLAVPPRRASKTTSERARSVADADQVVLRDAWRAASTASPDKPRTIYAWGRMLFAGVLGPLLGLVFLREASLIGISIEIGAPQFQPCEPAFAAPTRWEARQGPRDRFGESACRRRSRMPCSRGERVGHISRRSDLQRPCVCPRRFRRCQTALQRNPPFPLSKSKDPS